MRRPILCCLLCGLLILLAATALGQAQSSAPTPSSTTTLKQLGPEDLQGWKTIRGNALTPDGRWFGYLLAPNEGDAEVIIRATGAGTADPGEERRFAIGEPPGPGAGAGGPAGPGAALALSADGKWAAWLAWPKAADSKRLRKEKKPVQSRVVVLNVATGTTREFEKVRRFAFGGERPRWIALQAYGPEPAGGGGGAAGGAPGGAAGAGGPAASRAEGSDLLLHELGTSNLINTGNVAEFAFDESGDWLALTIDARDRLGNGLHLRNLRTDVIRVVESEKALYRRMAWADSGQALAALRGTVDSAGRDTTWAVLGVSGLGQAAPTKTVFAPADTVRFPAGYRISGARTPSWARDHSALFFGIVPKAAAPSATRPDVKPAAGTPGAMQRPAASGSGDDEDLPTLVIWHGKESRLQSQQQVEESRDKSFSYLAAYRIREDRFVRVATDSLRDVATSGVRWAYGFDSRPYELHGNLEGVRLRDVWAVDLRTGDRKRALSGQQYVTLAAPDGSRLLYYRDGHYHAYDPATGESRNLTGGLPVSFVNTDDDHNLDRPPRFPVGWTRDAGAVLLSDGWDVWKVPVRSGSAVNLTGNGKAERIRYGRRLVYDPKERGIDLSKPVYFQTYGEWTKREGLARIVPGRAAERLVWDSARVVVNRPRDAEVFLFSRQTFTEFPDYWLAGSSFATSRRLTRANPQQKDFAWSPGARLVSYVSDKGDSLQAALFLPAGYQPGKRYPTVVYIYEKLSQSLHQYAAPNETRALNPGVYTSRGYAVLMPDIVYRVNDPGMSAVWCVVPAVKAAIATGVVDSSNVGLHGHSWGGYQTAFLVTQTGLFKSAIAGAALTDLVSMYSSVYWNTGSANQPIFVSSQGRFKGNFLDHSDAYIRNSPAFHADKVKTPLLLLHNEKDGAVDFNQGVTFYNTLRQLGRDVVMLQYVGENHGLAQVKNQKDYTVRMREFFDHHLLGAEAPEWLEEGIPRLKMDEHLKARQPKPKLVP